MNLPLAPSIIRCSKKARIGATPVPGPIAIRGISGDGGNRMVPLLIRTRSITSPKDLFVGTVKWMCIIVLYLA